MSEQSLRGFGENNEIDQYILLAGLINGCPGLSDILPAESISEPFCRMAFERYRSSHAKGEDVDIARLGAAMGGGSAVHELLQVSHEYQATSEQIYSIAAQLRRQHAGAKAAAVLEDNITYLRHGYDADAAAARCRDAIEGYHQVVSGTIENTSIDAILRECGDRLLLDRRSSGTPFNIESFDHRIGGLHPGELIVVAARLKKGKSALMQSMVVAANLPTLIFSMEMTRREYLRNLVCIEGEIPSDALLDYRIDLDQAKEELRQRPIEIFDTPAMTASEIAAACYSRRGIKLVIVDYAQIMGRVRGTESIRESLVENVKALKTLAKRLEATVILGSQIGRGGYEKPMVKDLAESDELGRSADHILIFDWENDNPPAETKWDRSPVEVKFSLTSRHMAGCTFPMSFYRSQRRFAEARL